MRTTSSSSTSKSRNGEGDGLVDEAQMQPARAETRPLLGRSTSNASQSSSPTRQLSTRHAFAILVTLQIGSGIFASPSQVDSNVPVRNAWTPS